MKNLSPYPFLHQKSGTNNYMAHSLIDYFIDYYYYIASLVLLATIVLHAFL